MPLNTTEKQFESDIAAALLSPAGGYTRNGDCYDPKLGLFVDTLIRFVQKTQPNEWAFFEKQNPVNPVRKFCTAFNNACDADGLLSVLRYGFKHRGRRFRVCYFQPESALNQKDAQRYAQNEITCNRQWFYSLIRFLISVLLMLSSGVSTMVTPSGTLPMQAPWRG